MTQKIVKMGASAAVRIPIEALKELGLKIGDPIAVAVNRKTRSVVICPPADMSDEDIDIARLTVDFIHRYRRDLQALARK